MEQYTIFLWIMSGLAVCVFVALQFVNAGYGMMISRQWGPTISNRIGWILMEAPVFVAMLVLWLHSDRCNDLVRIVLLLLFQIHYFQRSFVFPFLIKNKGRMPLTIILMGMIFNVCNALMQGGWIFYFSPESMYEVSWFGTPMFIIGTILFFAGMYINIYSDHIIRHLRKPFDSNHYLPKGGMFKYLSSANYFGELLEWVGFAVLTWSWSGAIFVLWTFANLAPRANAIYHRYVQEFGEEFTKEHRKRIIPFIY